MESKLKEQKDQVELLSASLRDTHKKLAESKERCKALVGFP